MKDCNFPINSQIEKVAHLGLARIVSFPLLLEICFGERGTLSLIVLRFCMKQDVDSVEVASGSPLPGVKVIMIKCCNVSCIRKGFCYFSLPFDFSLVKNF